MSTFSGLNTALSGLYTQRRALEITGQNIANANTEGYSRQRVEMRAVENVQNPAMYSTGEPGNGGVSISGVTRLNDQFLDNRTRNERALNTYLTGQKDVYARIEQIIGEPSDTGMQSQMAELWAGFHDVANRPNDEAARMQLLSRANTVADTLNGTHQGLTSLWGATREQMETTVSEVNQTSTAVAELNQRIVVATQSGMPTNELADRRDLLLTRLSELTGANVRPRTNGSVDVLINGAPLVTGDTARMVEAVGAREMSGQTGDEVGVVWYGTTTSAGITSGQLASTLESLGSTIFNTARDLDTLALQLATDVNDQHRLGWDLNGDPGANLFSGTTAAGLEVRITDIKEIAASSLPPIPPDPLDPLSVMQIRMDGGNATKLANISTDTQGPDAKYRTFVVKLGSSAQTVYRRADIQNDITSDVDAARIAQSGVSLDEEMTNMLQFQRAYEAAAKVMSVVDATLETLINGIRR